MDGNNNKKQYMIAVVPGDGIGPEVCAAAVQVVKAATRGCSQLTFSEFEAGANCYERCGDAFPVDSQQACLDADAVLHGAAGLPGVLYPDGTEAGQDFSMKIRASLDLYANVRPIRLIEGVDSPLKRFGPGDIDYVFVRENTEGMYAARSGGNLLHDEIASDTMIITRAGTERVVRKAAELARQRNGAPRDGKRRVTIVDKSNVLRSFAFFRRVAEETLADYPDIEIDYAIVDAMTVHMVERPDSFDVIVCENLLGDILSDLGAATIGGLGMAASGEMGDRHGYFQASHGTAPDIAGKGIANPLATILSGAMMLDWLGSRHDDAPLTRAGEKIRTAVGRVLTEGQSVTGDLAGSASTVQCADAVCAALDG